MAYVYYQYISNLPTIVAIDRWKRNEKKVVHVLEQYCGHIEFQIGETEDDNFR